MAVGALHSVGITVWYGYAGSNKYGWWVMIEFSDYGHYEDKSICGKIQTSYGAPLSQAIDTIKLDAKRLGIQFAEIPGLTPHLFYLGDGENKDYPPPDRWREMLQIEAQRIGFYSYLSEEVKE
jgi:hypothetical protein